MNTDRHGCLGILMPLPTAGVAFSSHGRISPKDTAPLLWVSLGFRVSGGRLSRRGLFQGREKQEKVGRGASDHLFPKLSLKR
eukprot:1151408-Pelagomonas_calceolata.AAC.3